jgi:hypothetical protein
MSIHAQSDGINSYLLEMERRPQKVHCIQPCLCIHETELQKLGVTRGHTCVWELRGVEIWTKKIGLG